MMHVFLVWFAKVMRVCESFGDPTVGNAVCFFVHSVHNADYYMQEAKKLKHKADALVSPRFSSDVISSQLFHLDFTNLYKSMRTELRLFVSFYFISREPLKKGRKELSRAKEAWK